VRETGVDDEMKPMWEEITCLDDVPSSARQAAYQQFLAKWYTAVGLAPFGIVIFIALKWFADSTSRIWDVLVGATLTWAIAIAAYTFYLLFFLKCPRCECRFGSGGACRSCRLPRHRDKDF
jgi:hypothetical protein